MIDLPPAIMEQVQHISWGDLQTAAVQYQPAIDVLKKTWDKESLLEILQGHIAVPDSVINQALEKRVTADSPLKALSITSKANGRLEIHADTKKMGRVELSGNVEAFVHHPDQSYMTYRIRERALKDHGLMSWFFSRISLSMAEKLFGHMELAEDLPTKIKGNRVTVDFHSLLQASDLGKTQVYGHPLLNLLTVEQAVPHDGYIEFKTALQVPDDVRAILLQSLSK